MPSRNLAAPRSDDTYPDLFHWILDPPVIDRAVHFASTPGAWQRYSYEDLARRCIRMADGLVQAGARRNDVIVIVMPRGPMLVAALFGVMLAGAVPSLAAPPGVFHGESSHGQILDVVATAAPE